MQSELDTIGCVLQSFYGAVFRELFFPFSFFFSISGSRLFCLLFFCFSAFPCFFVFFASLLFRFFASLLPRFCFSASSSSSSSLLFCFFVPLLLRFSASLLFAAFLPLKPKLNKPQP